MKVIVISQIYYIYPPTPAFAKAGGGAWDHRRCGACFCWLATTLPSARHSGHCPLLLRAFKPAVCHLKRCAAASSRHSRHCPLLLRAFKQAVCQASNASNAARPLQADSGHCPLLLRAFKPAVCQASNASNARGSFEQALRPLPSVAKGVQACRLPGLQCLQRCVAASSRHSGHCPMLFKDVQACRLPGLKCLKRCAAASSRHSGHCPLLLMTKTLRGRFEQALRPLPSVVKGVQACRLADLKCLKGCAAASSRHFRPLPSVVKGVQACRLPGLKCLKRCAAASSRHSGHCPLLLRAFKPAVCQASNASNAARQLRAGTQATALCC